MLRAERKAGELLAGMEKPKGGRPTKNQSQAGTGLEDLGINKNQSSRWQEEATVASSHAREVKRFAWSVLPGFPPAVKSQFFAARNPRLTPPFSV